MKILTFCKHKYFLYVALLLCTLPVWITSAYLFMKINKINSLEKSLCSLVSYATKTAEKRKTKNTFLNEYKFYDNNFLEQKLCGYDLLNNEKKLLVSLVKHQAFKNNKKALEQLNNLNNNKISFDYINETKTETSSEIVIQLSKPIKINNKDLEQLLSTIENNKDKTNKPSFLISSFSLNNVNCLEDQKTLDMQIIQRNFKR